MLVELGLVEQRLKAVHEVLDGTTGGHDPHPDLAFDAPCDGGAKLIRTVHLAGVGLRVPGDSQLEQGRKRRLASRVGWMGFSSPTGTGGGIADGDV